jgi:hypothetical protein
MYLGWSFGGMILRVDSEGGDNCGVLFENNAAICSAIDLEMEILEEEKLYDALDEVGTDSEQLTAQHKSAAFAAGDLSLLLALSQHFIILSFGECSGVPDTTPPTRATSTKSNATRFNI